jgi:hypothetical protein
MAAVEGKSPDGVVKELLLADVWILNVRSKKGSTTIYVRVSLGLFRDVAILFF